ncbi:MAG: ATP-binding protein [Kangiellaceae bacterium]|jgi:signal transduction histidine kinase/CheY-like chemotaxis protein|nr:ATP-binding protein [Kangiellaceae bacterium]
MNPLDQFAFAQPSDKLTGYFKALQHKRAQPLAKSIFVVSFLINIAFVLHDYFMFYEFTSTYLTLRGLILFLSAALYYFVWISTPKWRLPIDHALMLLLISHLIIWNLLYTLLLNNIYYSIVMIQWFLIGFVTVQLGYRLVIENSISCLVISAITYSTFDISLLNTVIYFSLVIISCAIAILTSYKLSEDSFRLFLFERKLYEINKMAIKAQEDEQKASQAKSQFLANMSHEIKTPLTAIMGYAESIIEDNSNFRTIIDDARTIKRSSRHLLTLINDILDLSRVESGNMSIESKEVALFDVLWLVKSTAKRLAKAKNISIHFDYEFPLPEKVHVDSIRLKQILDNLCSNAIKFSNGYDVYVMVSANTNLGIILFKVIDNGIGIDQLAQRKLFRPFSQADSSTTRKFGGTGLGLYISKQLANKMAGDLTLASEVNKGSTFTLVLPINQDIDGNWVEKDPYQILEEHQKFGSTELPRLAGQVLLVDDHYENQALIKRLIEMTGAHCVIAENGKVGLETALVNDFDLILMDIQMPIMDGIEATKLIRATGDSTPIIALSANNKAGDVDTYLAAGCDQYLEKPIDRSIFFDVLAQYLDYEQSADSSVADTESSLDRVMADLSHEFDKTLHEKADNLTSYIKSHKLNEAKVLAHQIKGTAKSYGHPALSKLAAHIENEIDNIDKTLDFHLTEISRYVDQVSDSSVLRNDRVAS